VLSCEGQALRGHDVHLAYGPIHGPEGSLFDRVAAFTTPDARRISTHELPDLVREIHPLRDARALAQLRRLIRDLRPDVVHTHSSKAGILGRIAAFRESTADYRPAIVHTVHGPPFMPIEGSLLKRITIGLINECYAIAERHAARRCHVIVSVADAMTTQFRERNIGRPNQYVTVRSGIDLDPYLHVEREQSREAVRARLGFQRDDVVIGTVARLAEHKGHDDLLDCLPRLLKADPRIKLLWVGDGYKKNELLDRARAAGVSVRHADVHDSAASIVLTGLVPPSEVPGLMRAMDVLAHPSSREGLPRTIPQALLSGVVPVAYDVDGTREACIDGVTGVLVKHGDRDALTNALIRLASSPEERSRLATTGRTFVTEAFSAQRMVDDLDAVYQLAMRLATT
jgi:glycosyltransferase involved in cell wall biosynthesis